MELLQNPTLKEENVKVILKEGEIVHMNDYVLVNNKEENIKLLKLSRVRHSSYYLDNKVEFLDIFSNDLYQTSWFSDEYGEFNIAGKIIRIKLDKRAHIADEEANVNLNWDPIDSIDDFSQCFELCNDKIDNDQDEKIDCDDEQCINDPVCKPVPIQAVEPTCKVNLTESKDLRELQVTLINNINVGLLSADESNGKLTVVITVSGKTYTLTDSSSSVEITVENKKYKIELINTTDSNANINVTSCV